MRRHYVDSRICDLKDGDKVRVTGAVLETRSEGFILDDGTGMIKVWSDEKPKGLVQVLGIVIKQGEEKVIKADIVRDVDGLNTSAYKKLMDWGV